LNPERRTLTSVASRQSITLRRISYSVAQRFFKHYEHLGNCGLGVWHWGAFLDSQLIGAVSFGTTCFAKLRGPLSAITSGFDLAVYQITRGGTSRTAPFNTPSQVLSSALSELHKLKGDCLVVAYADRLYNEIGTIYQACNGIYTGQTEPKNQSNYIIHGRKMSGWLVRKRFGTRSMERLRLIDRDVVKLPLTSKYRYVFIQARPLRRRRIIEAIDPLSRVYPKRDSERIAPMDVAALVASRASQDNSSTDVGD
jgi:hypothetical protein